MDNSDSLNEFVQRRQKSLQFEAEKAADKMGKRMLSINPVAEKVSFVEETTLDEEELEMIEKRERLVREAKMRQERQNQEQNLMKAAQANQIRA
jgi:hypothetical protein